MESILKTKIFSIGDILSEIKRIL